MVEYLDPEIAGEGLSAEAAWQPFVSAPVIPTYKGIASIAKYFWQYSGTPYKHKNFPCWLYHPTKKAALNTVPIDTVANPASRFAAVRGFTPSRSASSAMVHPRSCRANLIWLPSTASASPEARDTATCRLVTQTP